MAVSAAITLVTNAAAPPPTPGGTTVNWHHLAEAVPSVELIAALVAIGAELLGHVPDGIGPAALQSVMLRADGSPSRRGVEALEAVRLRAEPV